jgi:flagellar biosynthesis/type III secretory pathway M-ring protein FliF/YscJ
VIAGVIGGVVGLLLIAVIIVIVIFLVRRKRKSNANHEDKQSVDMHMVSATPTIYSSIAPSSAASTTSKRTFSSQQLYSSDTSFFSVIPYKELKFIELVGKGAFGEVWKGKCHFDS